MQFQQKSRNFTRRISRSLVATAVVAALLAPVAETALANAGGQQNPISELTGAAVTIGNQTDAPRIQLAIILDTSNSMDGLIDQTRNQLWQVVNEFSSARQNGQTPVLEIALFEFGNDGNSASTGYLRMLNAFTRELDAVSQGLFSLTTSGGSEYCGYAIETVVRQLQWSRADSDIRTIFIAGNESFAQGPVDYRDAVRLASEQGISINTIHAGSHSEGIHDGWQDGAILAGGDYMSIDADQQVVHIVAPQDDRIAELNARLNQTYVPYGARGEEKVQRQLRQDELSGEISAGLLAKRAKSKSSSFYRNSDWDLVDALTEGEVDETELAEMQDEVLPEPMIGLSQRARVDYVLQKAEERKQIKKEIADLSRDREVYVAAEKETLAAAAPSVSDALTSAIKKQAQQKNFVFE